MDYGLHLTKEKKVIFAKNDLEEENEEISGLNILKHLYSSYVVSIDEWTVRDLMNLIKNSEIGVFMGTMAWCDFDAAYEDMLKPKSEEENRFIDNIEFIEFNRLMQIEGETDMFPEKTYEDYVDVCGINDSFTEEEKNQQFDENGDFTEKHDRYGISCVSLSEIADKPIRIKKNQGIYQYNERTRVNELIVKCNQSLNLFEIIYTFLYEISFHGDPKQRDEFADVLADIGDGIKNGDIKTTPLKT